MWLLRLRPLSEILTHVARERSIWGWGHAERFGDAEDRAALARRLAPMIGFPLDAPRDPTPLEAAELPPPRVSAPPALASFCSQDARARASHAMGKSYPDLVRGFLGDYRSAPDLVAYPRSAQEITDVLDQASSSGWAVIPFGGGTSVVGGVEASCPPDKNGVLSLDLSRLNRVLEVDDLSRTARVQAGVLGPALEEQLRPHGLTLRHYPQSFEFSTLGGWIATRAGGHFATGPTRIDDFVEAVEMITPRGLWQTRRVPSTGAAIDPDRLVLGSEGTLGVITEAWLRVDRPPLHRARAELAFESFEPGARAVREILQAGARPASCRLLDPVEAMISQVDDRGRAVLLLGFESGQHEVETELNRCLALCEQGERLETSASRTSWRQSFIEAPYLRDRLLSLGVLVETFETACPWSRLHELSEAVSHQLTEAMRPVGGGWVSRRITHAYVSGAALYFTAICPTGGLEGAVGLWTALKRSCSEAILRAGGTITHHHAVGRMHVRGLTEERSSAYFDVLEGMRAALDPAGCLNPEVLRPL